MPGLPRHTSGWTLYAHTVRFRRGDHTTTFFAPSAEEAARYAARCNRDYPGKTKPRTIGLVPAVGCRACPWLGSEAEMPDGHCPRCGGGDIEESSG